MKDMYNGIMNIHKEAGYTSFDVVARLRGICSQKKIGHTGTLDPMATGVLPVCLGKSTKVCQLLTDWDKEYVTELLLGITTDTLDIAGAMEGEDPGDFHSYVPAKERKAALYAKASERVKESGITEEAVAEAVRHFEGGYDQVPPMFSALKVNGQRLYDLARNGQSVERQTRAVKLYELEILETKLPVVKIRVLCSKGTYIRSLCADIGERLGTGGCMMSLVRTKVGPFTLENAKLLSEVEAAKEDIESLLLGPDALFAEMPKAVLGQESVRYIDNGNRLEKADFDRIGDGSEGEALPAKIRVYDPSGAFRALYEYDRKRGDYKVLVMF